MENVNIKADPIASAIFNALATGEKCICELKEAIGIPQTWDSYDLMMLEDLKAIKSRTVNGYKHFSLTPSRALWYVKRSLDREEPVTPAARHPARHRHYVESLYRLMPSVPEIEMAIRRGG